MIFSQESFYRILCITYLPLRGASFLENVLETIIYSNYFYRLNALRCDYWLNWIWKIYSKFPL